MSTMTAFITPFLFFSYYLLLSFLCLQEQILSFSKSYSSIQIYFCRIAAVVYSLQCQPYLFRNIFYIMSEELTLFQRLLIQTKTLEQIEKELKRLEQKSKIRATQIINKYRSTSNVDIDKIKRKNNSYFSLENKKEEQLAVDKIPKYLQGSWDLQKNKNLALVNQKKVYHLYLVKAQQAFKAVYKEYDTFVQRKKVQVKQLREQADKLAQQFHFAESNYNILSQSKVVEAQVGPYAGVKLYDIGLVPYLSGQIDTLFEKQMEQANLSKKDLQVLQSKRNNILGKVQFLVELLKRKQQEKKDIDDENDGELQFYNTQKEIFQKQLEQSNRKQKQALQKIQKMKDQQQKNIDFILKETKKFEHYPQQLGQFQRTIARLNIMHQRYLKLEQKRKKEYDQNNTVEKKLDRLIGGAKDHQEAKLKEEQERKERLALQQQKGIQLVEIKQIANEEPEQFEIEEIAEVGNNEDKVSQVNSGKASQDTVSSVSSKRLTKELSRSSKQTIQENNVEQGEQQQ